jgi:hypothetical protein
MTDQPISSPLPPGSVVPREGGRSGWVGWVIFAGAIMVINGAFNFIDGLVALFNDDWYGQRASALLAFNYTTWGWLLIIFGLVALFAGFGVLAGQTWARAVGVIMALANAVAHLAFIGANPVWSVLVITLDVVVIYALTVHGRELA